MLYEYSTFVDVVYKMQIMTFFSLNLDYHLSLYEVSLYTKNSGV